jgi:hypothetical protein
MVDEFFYFMSGIERQNNSHIIEVHDFPNVFVELAGQYIELGESEIEQRLNCGSL